MKFKRWGCLIVATVALVAAVDASGQEREPRLRKYAGFQPMPPHSHVPLPPGGSTTDPELLFAERLRRAQGLQQLRQRVQDISGQDLETIIKQLKDAGIDPHDPQFKKLLEKELQRRGKGADANLSPEEIETLKRLLDGVFTGKTPDKGMTTPDPDPTKGKLPDPIDKGDTKLPDFKTPDKSSIDDDSRNQANKQMLQLAKWLESGSMRINESPALKRTLTDLSKALLEHSDGRPGGSDWNAQLAQYNRLSRDGKDWFGKSWSGLQRFELPKAPSFSMPSMNLSFGGAPSVGLPKVGDFGGVGTAGPSLWKSLLTLGLLLLTAVFAWKLLQRFGGFERSSEDAGWRLGPWPVNPAAVATREELVRAFEYLSLLLLGRSARSWNHLEIATRLGGTEVERQQAAEALAALYERARYAPGDEPMAPEALAAFRRDLSLLAGTATA
ncbi:MAG: hypothetical protein K2R98_16080 [Gemmataceae bacterium]|nr:hypothetical protein [Gemmataceae bacterium]